jgi:hypothetical protein
MIESEVRSQSKVKGNPIGYATGLAIRFIFLREIQWAPQSQALPGIGKIEDRELKLLDLAEIVEKSKEAEPLVTPVQSFYRDITLSEESARRLPIVAVCTTPKDQKVEENFKNHAPALRVQIPGRVWSKWEGELVPVDIVEGASDAQPSANLELICHFADTMAFFSSGHVAYTLSILFRSDSFPEMDPAAISTIPVFPAIVLSLLDLARSDEGMSQAEREKYSTRENIKLSFVDDLLGPQKLDGFVQRRLRALANPSKDNEYLRVAPGATSEYCDVFSGLVRQIRKHKKLKPSEFGYERLTELAFSDLQSATCEIIEFDKFDTLQRSITEAKEYRLQSDSFGRGIAGLAQNVIDFEDQDDHEINDSLFFGGNVGGYSHFINAKAIVRFYQKSRSFNRMQHFIGGDPYFYFTVLAALYNEYLTNKAAHGLAELKPGRLIGASPYRSTHGELARRYEIFAAFLRPMIPNLFRYNTESILFDHIHQRRGIANRRETIEKELSRYETIAHDFEGLNLQRSNSQFNLLVIILALWSAFGALATAASLFVALHADTRMAATGEEAVDFSVNSEIQLMEISFWTAFFGLSIAAVVSLIFLATKAVPFLRKLLAKWPPRATSRPWE